MVARDAAWIDFNNDGAYQVGEEITQWNGTFTHPRTSSVITLYGQFTKLYAVKNDLTKADLTQAKRLQNLSLRDNLLTSLDVSKNINLTELFCYGNQLSSLDLSQNTALIRLDCEKNKLKSLNLEKNSSLSYLYCFSNELESLDVSHNPYLMELNCSGNKLKTLDLSANQSLQKFYCHNNLLEKESMGKMIATLVDRNSLEQGLIYVVEPQKTPADANVCTKSQVAALKAKNWLPLDYNAGKKPSEKVEYPGAEEQAVLGVETSELVLYPNPAQGFVVVENAHPYAQVWLYSMEGTTLMRAVCNAQGNVRLDLSALSRGSYLVQVGGRVEPLVVR